MDTAADEIKIPPVVAPLLQAAQPHHAVRTTTVAIVVGGWLKDQTTRTLQPALRAAGIHTFSPPGLDDWQHNIAAMSRNAIADARHAGATHVKLAMIGHSFGAQAVGNATHELAREGIHPALVALIDPVSTKPGVPQPVVVNTSFREAGGILQVYYRTFLLGPIRANIRNEHGELIATLNDGCRRISGTHNSICHCDAVVSHLVSSVKGLEKAQMENGQSTPICATRL
jgi:hypothetical protein